MENQIAHLKRLLWLILAALLLNIGYLATPFGKTEIGDAVGVMSLIAAGVIAGFVVLRWLTIGVKELMSISYEVDPDRREEDKNEVDPGQ